MGVDKYLDQQLHPETIDDSDVERRLAVLPTLQMASAELYQFYPPGPVVEQRAKDKNGPRCSGLRDRSSANWFSRSSSGLCQATGSCRR
jgi:hypothetical protein